MEKYYSTNIYIIEQNINIFLDNCGGTITLTSPKVTFGDGSGIAAPISYGPTCTWIIQPTIAVPSITLNFDEAVVASGTHIKVFNGLTTTAQVCSPSFTFFITSLFCFYVRICFWT